MSSPLFVLLTGVSHRRINQSFRRWWRRGRETRCWRPRKRSRRLTKKDQTWRSSSWRDERHLNRSVCVCVSPHILYKYIHYQSEFDQADFSVVVLLWSVIIASQSSMMVLIVINGNKSYFLLHSFVKTVINLTFYDY